MRLGVVMRHATSAAAIAFTAAAAAGISVALTADETQKILAHGPWQAALVPDPTNRVSGNPLAIELGRRLFFDPRMSPSGYMACVSCHQPDRTFTDAKSRAHGLADLERNTIALANLGRQRWYGWTGASDSLWMASLRPILDAREFDGSAASVVRLFRREDEYARCYRRVFGGSPFDDDETTLVNVGKALAAFQETLITARTSFDDYRDALALGDRRAAARYPIAAQRGLTLFVGRAGCNGCHSGPNFSDGEFHVAIAASRRADAGRHEGVREWQSSRFNLGSRYNDADPLPASTPFVRAGGDERGAYRTPSLRNVAVTAPYMHDGSVETLRDVIRQHGPAARPGSPSPARPPALSDREIDDLVAFLHTLTDANAERRPLPAVAATCVAGG
jgi:cytochrome c peroxidase